MSASLALILRITLFGGMSSGNNAVYETWSQKQTYKLCCSSILQSLNNIKKKNICSASCYTGNNFPLHNTFLAI